MVGQAVVKIAVDPHKRINAVVAVDATSRTRPDGSTETWTYDPAGLPTAVTTPTGTTNFTYDAAGNPVAATNPNGTTETRTWDPIGRLTALATTNTSTGATLTGQAITRDPAGNPTQITVTRAGTSQDRRYQYDANDRITAVCYTTSPCTTSNADQAWTYDQDGNRLTQRDGNATNGTTTTWTYNTGDQITSQQVGTATAVTPTYDTAGNLTNDGNGTTWTYNLAERTTSTTTGAVTTTYTYDGQGNRVTANTTGGPTNGATTTYQWDTNASLPVITGITATTPDPSNPGQFLTTTSNLYYGDGGTGSPLSQTVNGAPGWYSHDAIGGITDLTDNNATITQAQDWTPYGQPLPAWNAPTPSGPSIVLGYTGALANPDGTWYLRARNYNPNTGTFTAQDPLGYNGSQGANSQWGSYYAYVDGRVLVLADPSGLFGCDTAWVGIACAAVGGVLDVAVGTFQTVTHPIDTWNHVTSTFSCDGFLAGINQFNPIAPMVNGFGGEYDYYNQTGDLQGALDRGARGTAQTLAIVALTRGVGEAPSALGRVASDSPLETANATATMLGQVAPKGSAIAAGAEFVGNAIDALSQSGFTKATIAVAREAAVYAGRKVISGLDAYDRWVSSIKDDVRRLRRNGY